MEQSTNHTNDPDFFYITFNDEEYKVPTEAYLTAAGGTEYYLDEEDAYFTHVENGTPYRIPTEIKAKYPYNGLEAEEVYVLEENGALWSLNADIEDSVSLGEKALIMSGVVLAEGVEIGPRATVKNNTVAEPDVRIGGHASVGPNATLRNGAVLEDYVIVRAGTEIGAKATVKKNAIVEEECIIEDEATVAEDMIVQRGFVLPSKQVYFDLRSKRHKYKK